MAITKLCPRCKIYPRANNAYCKPCGNAYRREWYQKSNYRLRRREVQADYYKSANGNIAIKSAVKKYEISHSLRRKAWVIARSLENKPCIKCGAKADKHHADPSQPKTIEYLCRLHHKEAHKLLIAV